MMANGVVMRREEGTPQGGPLSPLLANFLLDEVDKELEKRGHSFVRYADDLNIYVRSKRAGERVMEALRGLYARLKLRINESKSAVARATERTFPRGKSMTQPWLLFLGRTRSRSEAPRSPTSPVAIQGSRA